MDPDTTPPDVTPSTPPHGQPPTLSQAEAARACGVSTATIRRARVAGKLANVEQDGTGGWRIPAPSLVEAGLLDRATSPTRADTVTPHGVSPDTTPSDVTPSQVAELRTKLAEAEQRAAVAETIAAERGQALDDMRLSMRALTAGTEKAANKPAEDDLQPPDNRQPTHGGRLRARLQAWRRK